MSEQNNPFAPYELQISAAERKEVIAPLLIELRESRGLSQRRVAQLLQVSPQTLNGWEKGRNEPPVEHLVRLSYLYGVSMDTICGKSIFIVPTKENRSKMLSEYRQKINALQEQLSTMENGAQKDQLQALLDGLRAALAMAADADK